MSDHKVLINGTEYSMAGGTVLLGGVEYELESGMAMKDGTVYEIPFGAKKHTVTITVNGTNNMISGWYMAYLKINNTQYIMAATLEVEDGTVIKCYVGTDSGSYKGKVYLNGKVVLSVSSLPSDYDSYDYTCTSDVSISLSSDRAKTNGTIQIVES